MVHFICDGSQFGLNCSFNRVGFSCVRGAPVPQHAVVIAHEIETGAARCAGAGERLTEVAQFFERWRNQLESIHAKSFPS